MPRITQGPRTTKAKAWFSIAIMFALLTMMIGAAECYGQGKPNSRGRRPPKLPPKPANLKTFRSYKAGAAGNQAARIGKGPPADRRMGRATNQVTQAYGSLPTLSAASLKRLVNSRKTNPNQTGNPNGQRGSNQGTPGGSQAQRQNTGNSRPPAQFQQQGNLMVLRQPRQQTESVRRYRQIGNNNTTTGSQATRQDGPGARPPGQLQIRNGLNIVDNVAHNLYVRGAQPNIPQQNPQIRGDNQTRFREQRAHANRPADRPARPDYNFPIPKNLKRKPDTRN